MDVISHKELCIPCHMKLDYSYRQKERMSKINRVFDLFSDSQVDEILKLIRNTLKN